jgi:hypothetical protein
MTRALFHSREEKYFSREGGGAFVGRLNLGSAWGWLHWEA